MKNNMFNIAGVLLNIVGGNSRIAGNMKVTDERGMEKTIRSHARDLDGLNPAYKAPPVLIARHKRKMDNLDPDIRNLLALCLAANVNDRPSLPYLVQEVERNVQEKTADKYTSYPFRENESDDNIRSFAQRHVLNPS